MDAGWTEMCVSACTLRHHMVAAERNDKSLRVRARHRRGRVQQDV